MTFLGTELDTVQQSLDLSAAKLADLRKYLVAFRQKLKFSLLELQLLGGHLNFTGMLLVSGWGFLNYSCKIPAASQAAHDYGLV